VASQIISEALGVGLEKIRVLEADTLRSPYDPAGTQACRVTFVCGEAARQGAEQLKEKILKRASEILDLPMVTLELKDSIITDLSGLPLMDLPTLASRCHRSFGETLCVNFDYQASANPGSYGANFVEVEVDTWTGFVQVKQIVAAHDVGKAINPEFVRGQIYGGIQMNLGYALCEEIVLNEDGRVKNKSFSKYHVINAPSMPPVEIVLIEAGEPGGPYGAKSIGESSSVATAPAVINAINHALGTRLSVLPATPERIIEALSDY
jgi:CO/xanthine dehydrogenase Mo-binding subunit